MGGNHTVILCTHQLREAEACCDRVGLLDRGKLVKVIPTEEIQGAGSLEQLFLEVTGSGGTEQ